MRILLRATERIFDLAKERMCSESRSGLTKTNQHNSPWKFVQIGDRHQRSQVMTAMNMIYGKLRERIDSTLSTEWRTFHTDRRAAARRRPASRKE